MEALPEKYYRQEHLPGAVNIPHDEIAQLAPKLIPDRQASIAIEPHFGSVHFGRHPLQVEFQFPLVVEEQIAEFLQ